MSSNRTKEQKVAYFKKKFAPKKKIVSNEGKQTIGNILFDIYSWDGEKELAEKYREKLEYK